MQTLSKLRIAIGSDHAGFKLKEKIKGFLDELGYQYKDYGTDSEESVDYPDFAAKVAEVVSKGEFDRGILVCGTGIGMSIAANKFPNVRATLCYDTTTARLSREHNDANVLTLGGRLTDEKTAKEIVGIWLKTEFLGERHARRVDKINRLL